MYELKNVYFYYDLMFSVDSDVIVCFICGFWNVYVYDWCIFEISCYGEYGKLMGVLWESKFE